MTPRGRKWERQREMAADTGEDTYVLRPPPNFSRVYKRRTAKRDVSYRISTWWTRALRYFHRAMGRQEVISVKMPHVNVDVHNREVLQMRIREWAAKNAYTLIVMSMFFIITWIVIVVTNIWAVSQNGAK